MLSQKDIDYINSLSYEEMLTKWRFAPAGDPLFVGEIGTFFSEVMAEKKKTVDYVAISKKIGLSKSIKIGWGN